ncbi:hypothetical protein BE221DRAFT_94373 [Ostreococcus tauri]|uniref:Uncharacterized protein n=1 Tax=Ostreococcus tauri TaxID=70448 RepID=A0A1Y5IES7_OSTTA|nr:hypothetical protein BE221DRAFT_94373 [Ostreococcus tauri]
MGRHGDDAVSAFADLEELLRDAERACAPRPGTASMYFDGEWADDALREVASTLGVEGGDAGASADIAAALTIDDVALERRLRETSLARLLGLGEEYEDACGYDGVLEMKAPASVMDASPVIGVNEASESAPTPPAKVTDEDSWLDELLDGD